VNSRGERSPDCDRNADLLAELALGTLTGRERAQALAHVEECPACATDLEQLSLAADMLLEAAPTVEPPLGFEVRLMERLGTGRATTRARRRQSRFWLSTPVAACLVAVMLFALVGAGFASGWLSRGSPHQVASGFGTDSGGHLRTESLVSGSRTIGEATVYTGTTSWLYMSVDGGPSSGTATCEVQLTDGSTRMLGTFWINSGYGAWVAPIASGMAPIQTASLITDGTVLASARFRS
jgi:Putative zinc-finger